MINHPRYVFFDVFPWEAWENWHSETHLTTNVLLLWKFLHKATDCSASDPNYETLHNAPPDPLRIWSIPAPSHRPRVCSRKWPPRHRTASHPQRLQDWWAGRGALLILISCQVHRLRKDFPERKHAVARGFQTRLTHSRSDAVSLRRRRRHD